MIYVGTFAKSMFPAMRLGFLIVPSDLVPHVHAMRRAADIHPPVLEQLALADFVRTGHYATHLRRMRSVYRERLEALDAAAAELSPARCGCGRFRRGYTPSQTWTAPMTSGCARKHAAAASKWRRCAPTTWTVPRRAVFCSGSRPPRRQPCGEVLNNWPRQSTPHVARIAHDATADRIRVRRRKARVLVVDFAMRPAESLSSWETNR